MLRNRALLVSLALLAVPAAPAEATHYQDHVQVGVFAPPRVYDDVITLPIEEFEASRPPTRMRVGGHTHRLFWNNALAGGSSTSEALKQMRRLGQSLSAVFADRPLKAAERRRFKVVTPMYDEADVMVVAADHPACSGLSRTQARAIVAGKITRWSEVVAGASSDAIGIRFRGTRSRPDLRLGARFVRQSSGRYKVSYPASARGSTDGGVAAAAAGDHSIAGVTAWSRVRGRAGICVVPLDGVAPSDATVTDGSYAEAFRVSYVVPRRRIRFALNRRADKIVGEFMKSDRAKAYLARRGLLVVGEVPPLTGGGGGSPQAQAPATDHAGRPITTTAISDGEQQLTGLQLDSAATAEGRHRLSFEPSGTLRRLTFDGSGACLGETQGGWFVKGAWRYPEHGGGLIARLGWFLGDGTDERVVDLPDAEPQAAYLDGSAYGRGSGAATCA
jgi:ABC-type phosphate transport system substrate-binding protein